MKKRYTQPKPKNPELKEVSAHSKKRPGWTDKYFPKLTRRLSHQDKRIERALNKLPRFYAQRRDRDLFGITAIGTILVAYISFGLHPTINFVKSRLEAIATPTPAYFETNCGWGTKDIPEGALPYHFEKLRGGIHDDAYFKAGRSAVAKRNNERLTGYIEVPVKCFKFRNGGEIEYAEETYPEDQKKALEDFLKGGGGKK